MHRKSLLRLLFALLVLSGPASGAPSGGTADLPDQPFRFSTKVGSGDRLLLHWEIAPGTYLYQEKIKLSLEKSPGVTLGDFQLPPPTLKRNALRVDGTVGDVAVYYHRLDLTLPLQRSTPESVEITLRVRFQGCADIGVCYPPHNDTVTLSLPPLGSAAATDDTTSPLSEQDRLAALLAGGNLWLTLALFYLGGLLLALTPCVFPLIPILSGIIVGQGEDITPLRGFLLSLVYVLAMAIALALAGVVAGLSGFNLQTALQNPWLLSGFALLFVLLALSMFGFYQLQLPSRWQSRLTEVSNRQRGGTFVGVAIMGFLSTLIVGPCITPFFAGALIYVASSGDALLGGTAFFTLGLGMGTPLLLIGASAGALLPRAGDWMNTIKAVFGVFFLAVAIMLLERILPAAVSMVLWGLLLVISAIYMGALRHLPVEASGWARFWKGLGVAILAYGILILAGAAAGGQDALQPLRGTIFSADAGMAEEHLPFRRIRTVADLERELAAAGRQQRPVMLDFYADWCSSCKELERFTFSNPAVAAALADFVLLQADVTANSPDDQALLQKFALAGPPAILFYHRDGRELRHLRLIGFVGPEAFIEHIRREAL
jgi:thiol:disulfide interchange protein DsbD